MEPGTKPKPTVVKIREGVRKSRINFAEPVAPESFAEPPQWLSDPPVVIGTGWPSSWT